MSTDLTRWRRGARDAAALHAHNADLSRLRLERARRALGDASRAYILRELTGGRSIPDVAAAIGVSTVRIHSLARRDPDWATALDAALLAGRDPNVPHGTETGYRWRHCRCPDCRQAHHGKPDRRPQHRATRKRTPQRHCECCGGPIRPVTSTRRFCSHSCGSRHTVWASCPCGLAVPPSTGRRGRGK